MDKLLSNAFLLMIMIGGFALAGTTRFGIVLAATDANGIIYLDTTWTKANSPYNLTGPLGVLQGITLTVEPGVTVNLNGYYIQVNGTLIARGSNTDSIYFNSEVLPVQTDSGKCPITFEQESSKWDEQTSSGCIIEKAVLKGFSNSAVVIRINNASPKISSNTFTGGIIVQKYSTSTPIISNNHIQGHIYVASGRAIIFNNIISNPSSGIPTTAIGIGSSNSTVFNNTITDCYTGIEGGGENSIISNNFISNCQVGLDIYVVDGGSLTAEKNLIKDNGIGIQILCGSPWIKDNTITNNDIGINIDYAYSDPRFAAPSPSIQNNNIYENSNYNLKSGISNNLDATSNWWGTTDQSAINQSIFDNKNDYNVGKVNFTPFLTEQNTNAVPDPNAPIPTPTPEQTPATSPTPTPSQEPTQTQQFEAILGAVIVLAVIGAGLGLLIYLIKRK